MRRAAKKVCAPLVRGKKRELVMRAQRELPAQVVKRAGELVAKMQLVWQQQKGV